MNDLLIRSRLNLPVTTGIPTVSAHHSKDSSDAQNLSFQQLLEQMAQGQELSFTKHAAERVAEREIPISQMGIERLNEGLQIAREKGLDDALILMDGAAFIVSAKNARVITALNKQELKGKVITNIDGTVIL